MSPRFRAILFDKDGTLLDFQRTWVPVSRACARRVTEDQDLQRALLLAAGHDPISDTFRPGSPMVAGTAMDVAAAWLPFLSHWSHDALGQLIDDTFAAEAEACAVPVQGIEVTLGHLATLGYRMGVATSDNTRAAHLCLAKLGVADKFDFVCGYDAGHGAKPGPGMVHGFCAAISVNASSVVVVGDSVHDLEMARRAGAGARVGVCTGPATRADLAPHADVVLESAVDLLDWLGHRSFV